VVETKEITAKGAGTGNKTEIGVGFAIKYVKKLSELILIIIIWHFIFGISFYIWHCTLYLAFLYLALL
jgi:hypothetical protein